MFGTTLSRDVGSAYSEYLKSGTMHGETLQSGLPESYKFPQPLFTPSTKADVGDKDENINIAQCMSSTACVVLWLNSKIVPSILPDPAIAPKLVNAALALFDRASTRAAQSGLLLADTKFEFGLWPNPSTGQEELILIDEVLTPDSSRFWPAEEYGEGKKMTGFDKQFLREWLLTQEDWKSKGEALEIPDEVVMKTWARYLEAFKLITGKDFVPL